MLIEAISLLLGELNQFIHQADDNPIDTAPVATWGNISQVDHPTISAELQNQLVLTLVNVEEEATLKNGPTFTRESTGNVVYHNAPLHLNLYLLFTANFSNYETALKRLAQVMTFFQGKQRFTPANSPGAAPNIDSTADLSLTMDLLSLSFEEINHLWGSLGGKELPFVVYRSRLITVRDNRVLGGGGRIREIDVLGRDATT